MVWETSPALTIASLAARLVKSLIPVAMLWVAKLILDRVAAAIGSGVSVNSREIINLVAIEFGLAVLSDLLARANSLTDSLLGDRFTNILSLRLIEHASRLDLVCFEDPAFHDKLERARRQTTGRLGLLVTFASLAQELITLATLSVGLIWFSPWLVLLLAVAVVPNFLGETHFAGLAYSLLYRWTPERRELDYVRMLGASAQSAKEVKIFGLGGYLAGRYRQLSDRFFAENRKLVIRRTVTGAGLNLIGTAGYYTAYLIVIQRTLSGALSIGDLTFLAGAFARSRSLMEGLLGAISGISDQALYLADLYEFFEMKPGIEANQPGALPAPHPIRQGFEFRGVGFRYPGKERWVLRDVSFDLKRGERLALIGENGAGKTTLVKLLCRLYEPDEGAILLDGIDLRDYDAASLRREIGVIFQDYMRYDMPARENIGLGRIEELSNEARIRESAAKSLADGVIAQLPGGLDAMLGRRFEGGSDLSAGQWQKFALARAYMRDAQLIVLDEPTASLDARAEFEVFQRFSELTRGRMAVLISHRFSTVRMADRILVLEGGAIREQGSHEELVALGGQYAELFALQAAGYR